MVRVSTLARQAVGEPVHLSGRIAKDPVESQSMQPRRGPGAQVSLVVITVDDDPVISSESSGRAVEEAKRDVDGARNVLLFVLGFG